MTSSEQTSEEERPVAISFQPPHPVYLVDDEGVIKEPVFALRKGIRAAVPNIWSDEEDRYLVGVVQGVDARAAIMDVGHSMAKLELTDRGWVCTALALMSAIAEGLAEEARNMSRSFTERLLKKASKKRPKR